MTVADRTGQRPGQEVGMLKKLMFWRRPRGHIPKKFKMRRFTETFREFVDREKVNGPVCHVGSLAHSGGKGNFRNQFAHCQDPRFVGIDLFAGLNVDVVADLCAPDLFERHPELRGHFNFVFCSALLEHVANPFDAARNIRGLLSPQGQIFYAGPWVQGFHPYPDDYWRISFSGLRALFPDIHWRRKWYSGEFAGRGIEFEEQAFERKLFLQKGAFGASDFFTDRALPYLMISAIGSVSPPAEAQRPD
jgi:hypothetical protein